MMAMVATVGVKWCLHYNTCTAYTYVVRYDVHVHCSVYTAVHVRRAWATYRVVTTTYMFIVDIWAWPHYYCGHTLFYLICDGRQIVNVGCHKYYYRAACNADAVL